MRITALMLFVLGAFPFLTAADRPADFSGTWILDARKSDDRAVDSNVSGPLVIVQSENEIQLHITVQGNRAYESFRLDGSKNITRLPNGHESTIETTLKKNTLEITNQNKYPGGIAKMTRRYTLSKDGKTLKMSSGGTTWVYRRSENTPVAAARPQNPSPAVTTSKVGNHVAEAFEAVKKLQATDGLQLEVMGEPVLKPDGARLQPSIPDAIVLVNLKDGQTIRKQAIVLLASGRPPSARFSPQPFFSQSAMDQTEFQQVANELELFYSDAADISRGSERFYPYLPDDIRSLLKHRDRKLRMYMPPGAVDPAWRETLAQGMASGNSLDGISEWQEKLSDEELRRFVAVQLNAVVQKTFLAIGGYEKEVAAQADRQRPQATVSNPREYTKQLEENVAQNRSLLQRAGFLSPDRLKATSSFIKPLIGYGFIEKEVSNPNPCPCFAPVPENAAFYVTSLGLPSGGLALHFSRIGGRLRIICAALP